MTNRIQLSAAAVLAAVALAGCSGMSGGAAGNPSAGMSGGGGRPGATAELAPTGAVAPNPTVGRTTFTVLPHGLRVAGEVRGLVPGSEHGFHIHEKGDCGANAEASGGHFNPTGGTHGKYGVPGSHAGELPSLVADASGVARFSVEDHTVSLTDGADNNVVGRALVVHRDPDDFRTQPAGNSGPRIACAVIARS